MEAPIAMLTEVERLLDAHEPLEAFRVFGGPPGFNRRCVDADAWLLHSRMAWEVGSKQRARRAAVRAHHGAPNHARAASVFASHVLDLRGPWDALQVMQRIACGEDVDPRLRSRLWARRSMCHALLHDFGNASAMLERAVEAMRESQEVFAARCALAREEDRYEDAVRHAREAHELDPKDGYAAAAFADTLRLVGRDDEAIELLTSAMRTSNAWPVAMVLASMQWDRREQSATEAALVRLETLTPARDAALESFIVSIRADLACARGDRAKAVELAKRVRVPFFSRLAQRLESAPRPARVVRLDVPFVRQHEKTCAPATLAMLARFWKRDAEHLSIADEICFDGTPDAASRRWCEQNGYFVREFTVTWESAVALLDRGVPFAMSTVEASSAHMQIIGGYDAMRGTLLLRDPTYPSWGEVAVDDALERWSGSGPRCMAIVPSEQRELIGDLVLPDAAPYEPYHQLQIALLEHRVDDATRASAALESLEPEGRLALLARLSLATYDGRHDVALGVLEILVARYPKHEPFVRLRVELLQVLGQRDEARRLLAECAARPDADPLFLRMYADDASNDARGDAMALRWLRRALRRTRSDGVTLSSYGRTLWNAGERALGLEAMRLGVTREPRNEPQATLYDTLARLDGKGESSIAVLQARCERFGAKNSGPAITLTRAKFARNDRAGALEALARARALRPDDVELAVATAHFLLDAARLDEAAAILESVGDRAHRSTVLRAKARLLSVRGRWGEATDAWRELVDREPLALDAHDGLIAALSATRSADAPIAHLRAALQRFPLHRGLRLRLLERLRADRSAQWLEEAQALVALDPVWTWARRELALALENAGRPTEAVAQLDEAARIDPRDFATPMMRAQLSFARGRVDDACSAARTSIELFAECREAVMTYLGSQGTDEERTTAARWVLTRIDEHGIDGTGLDALVSAGRWSFGEGELERALEGVVKNHPRWLGARSAQLRVLLTAKDPTRSVRASADAVEAFPLEPSMWLARARALRGTGDTAGETGAIDRALALAPTDATIVARRAWRYEDEGNFDAARDLFERSTAAAPWNVEAHLGYALFAFRREDHDVAAAHAETALRIEPRRAIAWAVLRSISDAVGDPEHARRLAAEIMMQHPRDAAVRLACASMIDDAMAYVAALREAVALEPHFDSALDALATALVEVGEFDEARAVCRQGERNNKLAASLRGRLAWIDWVSGHAEEAIAAMTRVAAETPGYAWASHQLAVWRLERGELESAERAAREVVIASPESTDGQLLLAEVHARRNEFEACEAAFEAAARVDPDDNRIATRRIERALAKDDADRAAALLARARGNLRRGVARAYDARIAIVRNDRDAAERALADVALAKPHDSNLLLSVAEGFMKARWFADLIRATEPLLDDPQVDPEIGAIWCNARLRETVSKLADRIDRIANRDVAATAAARLLAEDAADDAFGAFVRDAKRFGAMVRPRRGLWDYVMRALGKKLRDERGFRRAARAWLEGWREQEEQSGEALLAAAATLRILGRDVEATEASTRAIERGSSPGTSDAHRLWLWADALFTADAARAHAMRSGIDSRRASAWYQLAIGLVDSVHQYVHGNTRGRLGDAKLALGAASLQIARGAYSRDPLLNELRLRAWEALAKAAGSVPLQIEAFVRRHSRAVKFTLWALLILALFVAASTNGS